jgi:hypothetical protein
VDLLPPRPRRASFKRFLKNLLFTLAIFAFGVGLAGGFAAYAIGTTRQLVDDREVYANGTLATDGRVEGTSRTRRFLLHEYELTLHFADQKGERHAVKQKFDAFLGSVDDDASVDIRYDPANPSRAVSSWSIDVTVSRAAWAVVSMLMSAFGVFVLWFAAKAVVRCFVERSAAVHGLEVRARLVGGQADQHGNVTYSLAAEVAPQKTATGTCVLSKGELPFWVGDQLALAFYHEAKNQLFLVDATGLPAALSDAELVRARDAAAAQQSSGPRLGGSPP